jgi:hypothetical protein
MRIQNIKALFVAASLAASLPAAAAPDLFQVWKPAKAVWTLTTADGKAPPLNAKGKALYTKRVAARAAGKPIDDTTLSCLPHGMPRLMLSPYPFRIYQKPEVVAFVHELHHMHRIIYLNDKLPPADELDTNYMGASAARYDGDALVVESRGYNDKTTLDRSGLPHGEQLELTERYRLVNGGKQLEGTFTITDPEFYSKPWTARVLFDKGDPATVFDEYVCTDQNPEVALK